MKLYEKVYDTARIAFWILYILTFFNIWKNAPHYLEKADNIFKIFLGLVLIYLSSPFRQKKITIHDQKIFFEAGIMLLLSSSLRAFLQIVPLVNKAVV